MGATSVRRGNWLRQRAHTAFGGSPFSEIRAMDGQEHVDALMRPQDVVAAARRAEMMYRGERTTGSGAPEGVNQRTPSAASVALAAKRGGLIPNRPTGA